jgi:hypothetical protein
MWYYVFHHLRGTLPSYEKVTMDREIKKQLCAELEELRKLVPRDLAEEDWAGRRRIGLERGLRPKVSLAEPKVWRALVAARTAIDLREVCRKSKRWLNPKWEGRPYVQDLHDHAEQFLRAKEDVYYPRRDSADEKRVKFFARAMSGITLGISPITAIDRLRKMKHGRKCPCVHCDIKRWDRIDTTIYRLFFSPRR